MSADVKKDLPRQRKQGLIIKRLPDEVLVYDQDRDRAHCLNQSAAAVWEQCDGQTTAAEIARSIQKQTGATVGEEVVWLALEQLGRDHLLEESVHWPASLPAMTRREAVRRIGIGAAVALPLVTSIIAPTPAQAATCLPSGANCTSDTQCCSGNCTGMGNHLCK